MLFSYNFYFYRSDTILEMCDPDFSLQEDCPAIAISAPSPGNDDDHSFADNDLTPTLDDDNDKRTQSSSSEGNNDTKQSDFNSEISAVETIIAQISDTAEKTSEAVTDPRLRRPMPSELGSTSADDDVSGLPPHRLQPSWTQPIVPNVVFMDDNIVCSPDETMISYTEVMDISNENPLIPRIEVEPASSMSTPKRLQFGIGNNFN